MTSFVHRISQSLRGSTWTTPLPSQGDTEAETRDSRYLRCTPAICIRRGAVAPSASEKIHGPHDVMGVSRGKSPPAEGRMGNREAGTGNPGELNALPRLQQAVDPLTHLSWRHAMDPNPQRREGCPRLFDARRSVGAGRWDAAYDIADLYSHPGSCAIFDEGMRTPACFDTPLECRATPERTPQTFISTERGAAQPAAPGKTESLPRCQASALRLPWKVPTFLLIKTSSGLCARCYAQGRHVRTWRFSSWRAYCSRSLQTVSLRTADQEQVMRALAMRACS